MKVRNDWLQRVNTVHTKSRKTHKGEKMSELSSYEIKMQELREMDLVNRIKGSIFEKISKRLLKEMDPAKEYAEISLWSDWEHRGNERDCGIDLVIKTEAGEFIAVQCKFYREDIKVALPDLSTFFTKLQSGVGEIQFAKGIIITTSNLTQDAYREVMQIGKKKPIELITKKDLIESGINWEAMDFTKTEETPAQNKKNSKTSSKGSYRGYQGLFF